MRLSESEGDSLSLNSEMAYLEPWLLLGKACTFTVRLWLNVTKAVTALVMGSHSAENS